MTLHYFSYRAASIDLHLDCECVLRGDQLSLGGSCGAGGKSGCEGFCAGAYRHLEALGALMDQAVADKKARAFRLVRVGSLFWPYYSLTGPIPTQAEKIAPEAVAGFKSRYGGWLEAGFYLPPSAYEVGFLCAAHSPGDVERLVAAL